VRGAFEYLRQGTKIEESARRGSPRAVNKGSSMMRIYRVQAPDGAACLALREGDVFKRLNMTLEQLYEALESGQQIVGGEGFVPEGNTPKFLAPVEPGKVVCVGLNYAKHAAEMKKELPEEPVLFMKPATSVIGGSGAAIELPWQSREVHHEGELAVVIGKRAHRVSEADAMGYVLGYTCANDVTARDLQRKDMRYTRAKGFDTFCPLGPALVLRRDFDPEEHTLVCRVNGDVRQESRLDDWIFSIPKVISYISEIMTLLPGDVILTGTPAGVGALVEGDVVDVEIDGIGVLQNRVVSAQRDV
jgi:2-keto-4-pentenoate hydratase/2-oxohepta-3-ene-1,7-dioic acid hydratase in catechol pathway